MNLSPRDQILDEAVGVSHCANTIRKSMNPIILPPDLSVHQWPGRPGFHTMSSHTKDSKKKMVLDASLLNTQHYMVWIKGKVEQSHERSSALPYTLV